MPADLFESAYLGTPPWDIGRSQPAIMRLAETGQITGLVLDIGCGTGENVLYLAEHGFVAAGIGRAATAHRKVTGQTQPRGSEARFAPARAVIPAAAAPPVGPPVCSGPVFVF